MSKYFFSLSAMDKEKEQLREKMELENQMRMNYEKWSTKFQSDAAKDQLKWKAKFERGNTYNPFMRHKDTGAQVTWKAWDAYSDAQKADYIPTSEWNRQQKVADATA